MNDRTVVDIWQYARHMLDDCGYQDHKPEIECRVNAFGYVFWHIQILDKSHYMRWQSEMWTCYPDMLNALAAWLNKHTLNGMLPQTEPILPLTGLFTC